MMYLDTSSKLKRYLSLSAEWYLLEDSGRFRGEGPLLLVPGARRESGEDKTELGGRECEVEEAECEVVLEWGVGDSSVECGVNICVSVDGVGGMGGGESVVEGVIDTAAVVPDRGVAMSPSGT